MFSDFSKPFPHTLLSAAYGKSHAGQNCVRYGVTVHIISATYEHSVNHGLERMWKEVVKGKVHPITCHEGTKVE